MNVMLLNVMPLNVLPETPVWPVFSTGSMFPGTVNPDAATVPNAKYQFVSVIIEPNLNLVKLGIHAKARSAKVVTLGKNSDSMPKQLAKVEEGIAFTYSKETYLRARQFINIFSGIVFERLFIYAARVES